ncbi:tRNA uridine-5-carboxymethylaminomethyl(34) synthesis GTPase MnmE [Sphingomonas sp. LY54]|uniref:tRNA uridine-5-carboxymethylaminomethyl(34) synthesis GTPase MnmE n=1 Tax=Sphingomonas sp. LY54 TaxID=3095343 RepID=UPI002D788449|nr:tRNA uridine-5-carboxymethylaminomethyl(34) synthesis GTPase MnmE [Sphingomonas sp. LY54]WRP27360.1 tRNA uridine-5-carboxymethylaminomethyl(34) synthesis GTPase MnmE [Sphingomonas sp. LY54]
MSQAAADTIYALSSGNPPAAIAVVRVSGPMADEAVRMLAGRLPEPRRASLATLRHPALGDLLDNALVIRFPGPNSSTGEDLVEFHLHGGRSVVAAVLEALTAAAGLRPALPGEFTRRAFENGRIDLAEAEGLADLLMAETDSQRRAALALAGGALSRQVEQWQQRLLALAAQVEAALDFADEGDVEEEVSLADSPFLRALVDELAEMLSRPGSERLRDGVRVVIAGPPNAGKSSLLNALAGRRAAITSPIAGTTRDRVEAPTAIGGSPFLLVDTAGLRESGDEIETIGVGLAKESLADADLILWLGDPGERPDGERTIVVAAKSDLRGQVDASADISISAETGAGMNKLVALLVERTRTLLPREGEVAINARHRALVAECLAALREAAGAHDLIIASEALRHARGALDRITGRAGVEDMLDALFGQFCIGK